MYNVRNFSPLLKPLTSLAIEHAGIIRYTSEWPGYPCLKIHLFHSSAAEMFIATGLVGKVNRVEQSI